MEEIKKFILNEYKYNCMMWGIKCVPYEEFYNWNIKCLNESPEDVVLLNELCKRMSGSKIKLMDEVSNMRYDAYAFYFDSDKNIVISTPRRR